MLQAVRDLWRNITPKRKKTVVTALVVAVVAILGQEVSSSDAGLIETLILDNLERVFG